LCCARISSRRAAPSPTPHGVQADLHLERLWSQNITITTRLVDNRHTRSRQLGSRPIRTFCPAPRPLWVATWCRVGGLHLRNAVVWSGHLAIWDHRGGLPQCRTARRDGSCRPPRTSSAAADQGWHSTDDGRWCGLLIIASGQLYTHFGAERCRSAKSPRAKQQGRFLDVSY
jgi:hypothetical protein